MIDQASPTARRRGEGAAARRFTVDGSAELERRMAGICHGVLGGILDSVEPSRVQAVLLGGGYGRGEGGVLKTLAGDRPYNDVEFYVAMRADPLVRRPRYQARLHHLAELLSVKAGVEVELKVISLESLRRARLSMFYYDLIAGHQWVLGDESLLASCDRFLRVEEMPESEGIRLLLNRCTGLLLARGKLMKAATDADAADFVARNHAKLQLALGDAVLTSFHQYHWSCRERHRRLQSLLASQPYPWAAQILRHHAVGVEFKLHPYKAPAGDPTLGDRHQDLTALARQIWLWVEQRRLQRSFDTVEAYATDGADKLPETGAARNLVLNLAALGLPSLRAGKSARHPRERLLNALPLLLWPDLEARPELRRVLRNALGVGRRTLEGFTAAYLRLWRRFA